LEIYVEKSKPIENFNSIIPSKNYDRTGTTRECVIFLIYGRMLTNDGRCICEIKSRIVMEKAAFNKKRALFT
jgi:hypothetical protein